MHVSAASFLFRRGSKRKSKKHLSLLVAIATDINQNFCFFMLSSVCLSLFLRSKYQAYEKNKTTITFEFLISKVRIFFNLIQVKVSPSTNDISFLSLNILLYWTLACLFLSSFVVSGVVVATCTHFISDVRLIIGNDNVVIFEWIESLAFFLGQ